MIQKAIDSLNEALKNDPDALNALIAFRVPCNSQLNNHPTVQTGDKGVGILGILNGALEPITGERIAALYDDEFQRVIGFCKFGG